MICKALSFAALAVIVDALPETQMAETEAEIHLHEFHSGPLEFRSDPHNAYCSACSALFQSTVAAPPSHAPLTTAEVVVAQCHNKGLGFLPAVATGISAGGMELLLIRIYSKCGVRPEPLSVNKIPILISTDFNRGRNDQAWAMHFAQR